MSETQIGLEEALCDLEHIVERLEEGKMGLEESLVLFEKGMALVRLCNSRLESAERRIESLTGEVPADLVEGDKA
jgi:exodeoxyribonuclease VII small subunit